MPLKGYPEQGMAMLNDMLGGGRFLMSEVPLYPSQGMAMLNDMLDGESDGPSRERVLY